MGGYNNSDKLCSYKFERSKKYFGCKCRISFLRKKKSNETLNQVYFIIIL